MEKEKLVSEQENQQEFKSLDHDPKHVIPVIEEHLHVGTKLVETGRINISKKVLEEIYDADIPLLKEEVIVEKKQINEFIEGDAPALRMEGDTTIIPIVREVIVKRLLLVEELHITKRRTEKTVPIKEVLRREEVTVKRNDSPSGASD